jgi:hypothetical protein
MESVEDELLARVVLSKKDFQDAEKYLSLAKKQEDKFVRDGLIKIGIVTYAKPFLRSTGVNKHKSVKKFCLFKEQIVPEEYYWLHQMFMDYRGNYIGHSNFNSMKPEVPIEPERKDGMVSVLSHTTISYDHWFIVDPEFKDMPLLIDQAINLFSIVAGRFGSAEFTIR